MDILIANPYFPPYAPGGAEYSLLQMCERFAERGWAVKVVTNCYDGNPRCDNQNGYEVEWINCPVRLLPGQQVDATRYTSSIEYDERLANALIKSAAKMGPNIILLANNAQSYLGTVKAAQRSSIPSIGIVRDTQVICEAGACIDNKPAADALSCLGPLGMARCFLTFQRQRGVTGWRPVPGILAKGFMLGRRREFLRKEGIRKFDRIVTISDALRKLIENVPQLKSEKVTTIRNFHTSIKPASLAEVDSFLERIGLSRDNFFLFAGRKTYGKGVDIAVDAAREIAEIYPKISLLFLGRGEISKRNVKNVVDHESVSQSLLIGILLAAKALIIPGRWQEGLHRTMIDAMFAGVPVICTEAGAPPVDGVMDGSTGYTVPCGDASALAKAMVSIMGWTEKQKEVCRYLSERRFKANFGVDHILNQWEVIFKELIDCSKQDHY